jgi:ABC-type glycerol-3-phosphate transport system substrate-binding protein
MKRHRWTRTVLGGLLVVFLLGFMAQAAPVELRFNYWRMGTEPQKTIMDKIIKNFEAENPGIKILVEPTPQNSVVNVLTTQMLAGAPPDVSAIANSDVARFVKMNGLEPLTPYLDKDRSFKEVLLPQAYQINEIKGKIYGLTHSFGCDSLFYNRDLFKKAGLPDRAPKDSQEFIEFGKKIAALGNDYAGFALFGGKDVGTDVRFFELFWALDVDVFNVEKKAVYIDTPKGIEALQFIVDLHRKHKITTAFPAELDYPAALRMFINGKLGMLQANVGSIAPIEQEAPNLNFMVAPFVWKKVGAKADGGSFTIAKASKHKKEAWLFVKYLMSFESIRDWAVPLSYLPPRKDVMALPEIRQNKYLKVYFDEILPYSKPIPQTTSFNQLMEVSRRELSMALLGKKTVEQAAKDSAKEMREILKKE